MTIPACERHATPRLSLITVVRNDPEGLRRTLESVRKWKGGTTEYLVIDGASTDSTPEVAGACGALVDRFVSEPDRGVYDAMNKGIGLATGEYVQFLNAGDELLIDPEELLRSAEGEPVMVYGRANMINPDGSLSYVKGKRIRTPWRFLKGMPLCHQAIIYRRETIIRFDTAYSIMADRAMTFMLLKKWGLHKTYFVDAILVNYYEGGLSSSISPQAWRDEENLFYRQTGTSWYLYKKKVDRWFKDYVRIPLKRLTAR